MHIFSKQMICFSYTAHLAVRRCKRLGILMPSVDFSRQCQQHPWLYKEPDNIFKFLYLKIILSVCCLTFCLSEKLEQEQLESCPNLTPFNFLVGWFGLVVGLLFFQAVPDCQNSRSEAMNCLSIIEDWLCGQFLVFQKHKERTDPQL